MPELWLELLDSGGKQYFCRVARWTLCADGPPGGQTRTHALFQKCPAHPRQTVCLSLDGDLDESHPQTACGIVCHHDESATATFQPESLSQAHAHRTKFSG